MSPRRTMSTPLVLLVLLALVALAHGALVKRDAPTAASVLEDLQRQGNEFQKVFADTFKDISNSPSTQQLQRTLAEGSDSLAHQLSAFASTLQGAIADASGKAKEQLEQSRVTLERTAEELRRAHPEVEQQATALRDQLAAAVQTGLQETQKVAKEVAAGADDASTKLAPKIKEAYEGLVRQAQEVQQKVHEVATQH